MFKRRKADHLWDHFVNSPPADPNNDLTTSLRNTPGGMVFPAKSNPEDPSECANAVKDLALWWGANLVGIVALEPGSELAQPVLINPSENPSAEATGRDAQPYLFGIVCALFSEYDPAVAPGLGGQQVAQKGAVVTHYLGAYIRELGFRATTSQADPLPLAVTAGLGRIGPDGNLISANAAAHTHVADVVVTDLPLVPSSGSD